MNNFITETLMVLGLISQIGTPDLMRFDEQAIHWDSSIRVGGKSVAQKGTIFETLFNCKSNPCIIRNVSGGDVMAFAFAAQVANEYVDWTFVIDGDCASACALFADKARDSVCITKNATFGFHKFWYIESVTVSLRTGERIENKVRYDPPYSRDIDGFLRSFGDYPENHMIGFKYDVASHIWFECELNPPLPRTDPRKTVAATASRK